MPKFPPPTALFFLAYKNMISRLWENTFVTN